MSEFSKDELLEHARENVKALRFASKQSAFKSARPAIERDLKLAEIALATLTGLSALGDVCPACGSHSLTWDNTIITHGSVPHGRLTTSDVSGLFYLGCDECSETVANVSAEQVAAFMNASRAAVMNGEIEVQNV